MKKNSVDSKEEVTEEISEINEDDKPISSEELKVEFEKLANHVKIKCKSKNNIYRLL
jgi:hypothetical protein